MYLDIETRGKYPDYGTYCIEDERGAILFKQKYEKTFINEYTTVEEAYISLCGLLSTYGEICCITLGFRTKDGSFNIKSLYSYDEVELIKDFSETIKKIDDSGFSLAGFGLSRFDIPWINKKLIKNNIEIPPMLSTYNKKPWEYSFIELSDIWKSGSYYSGTLDEACYELGIDSPKSDLSGKDVHKHFWDNKLDDIVTYCEKDVLATILLGERLLNP